jgi:hypothetical protein
MGLPGRPANGGSGPRFYDFDDGVTRLVKWFPSGHGAKMCFNELIASRLGQLIDAPILRGCVVYVRKDIIPSDHLPEAKPGFQFGVARMQGDNFRPVDHYNEIENRDELASAAVLLAWLDVADHEGHNQFLQRLEKRLVGARRTGAMFRLIDMGWAFGDGDWRAETVAGVSDSYRLPRHMADKLCWDEVQAAIDVLQSVPEQDIRDCVADIPSDWAIPETDIAAVTARILEARAGIRDIIGKGNPDVVIRVRA